MYILTQDAHLLMEFGRVEISKNLTAKKDEKFVLVAWGRALANPVTIGAYPSEAEALAEVAHIADALEANQTVYKVR